MTISEKKILGKKKVSVLDKNQSNETKINAKEATSFKQFNKSFGDKLLFNNYTYFYV